MQSEQIAELASVMPVPQLVSMPVPQPPTEAAAMIAVFERALRDTAVPIERARELYQLRREMKADDARDAFNDAMSEAQGEMGMVRRDASNPQTRSRYASHAALDHALRPTYSKHGFALSFDTGESPAENVVRVECFVTCAGHTRKYHIDMPADGKGAKGGDVMTRTHATGSAITYGRRYLLLMIFNIAVGDDDGNTAGKVESSGPVTIEQLGRIQQTLVQNGVEIGWLLDFIRKRNIPIDRLEDIPASICDKVISAIASKAAQDERSREANPGQS